MELKLKRGIYQTEYGNAAYVSGPNTKTAYDLDMAERIPMSMVTSVFIRKAEPSDTPAYSREYGQVRVSVLTLTCVIGAFMWFGIWIAIRWIFRF